MNEQSGTFLFLASGFAAGTCWTVSRMHRMDVIEILYLSSISCAAAFFSFPLSLSLGFPSSALLNHPSFLAESTAPNIY